MNDLVRVTHPDYEPTDSKSPIVDVLSGVYDWTQYQMTLSVPDYEQWGSMNTGLTSRKVRVLVDQGRSMSKDFLAGPHAGTDWCVYDVGGSRSMVSQLDLRMIPSFENFQRSYWVPYFEDGTSFTISVWLALILAL